MGFEQARLSRSTVELVPLEGDHQPQQAALPVVVARTRTIAAGRLRVTAAGGGSTSMTLASSCTTGAAR